MMGFQLLRERLLAHYCMAAVPVGQGAKQVPHTWDRWSWVWGIPPAV